MVKLSTPQEIKDAVNRGKQVFADSKFYQVIKDSKGQFLIKAGNGHCIGLTGAEGTIYENKLNGKNFFTED